MKSIPLASPPLLAGTADARAPAAAAPAWRAALVLALWLACTAGLRPLMLPDEGRYVGVAWQMLVSGDWLTPRLDGLPFFHKPPLFYWLSASSMAVLGVNEFAARLPSLLAAWATGMGLYLFLARWCDRRTARLSLLGLALQPLFFCGAQFANLDMLVAGLISLAILAQAHAQLLHEQGGASAGERSLPFALVGLGVLAKGLIGAVLPALVIGAWLLARRRPRDLARLFWWPGLLLAAAICGPWFLLEAQAYPGFLHYFFVVQHFQRFAGAGFNNVQPWWFYPAVLALFGLPWLYWWARHLRDAVTDLGSAPAMPLHPVYPLMWIWPAAVVVFFSIPQSKLVGYVLPAAAPMAFWTAAALVARDGTSTPDRRRLRLSAAAALACCIAVVAYLSVRPVHTARDIGRALAAARHADEPVFAYGGLPNDVIVYAGLRDGLALVDDWAAAEQQHADDWRQQMIDAGLFEPQARERMMIAPAEARRRLCGATAGAWIVSNVDAAPLAADIGRLSLSASEGPWRLWQLQPLDVKSPACR